MTSCAALSQSKAISSDLCVSIGVVVVIMRVLCILFKSLLLSHSQLPYPYRNKDMEISYESTDHVVRTKGKFVATTS